MPFKNKFKGTLWLAEAFSVDFTQAFEWGVKPFLIWNAAKIVVMAIITTKFWAYDSEKYSKSR
ncbi:MAG TPA: hypothetical protein D7H86_06085 [Candidatus Poseidoniales archaeon]|nr:MAG TPA: hypothetical protein D7H86_06085 [Candidatus Poseidoniales archaeon]|tara:strand:- start:147 stop:335 length:189 start_codon:yes stop_codon:yes gene_type:complete